MKSSGYVFSFADRPVDLPAAEIGAKARNLWRAHAEGFDVPDGYVVTGHAWAAHLESAGLDPEVRPEDVRKARNLVLTTPLPEEVGRAVREAHAKLAGPVAVRSSAADEDRAHQSWAGKFQTYLEVEGVDEVVSRVRQCFASLWDPRAVRVSGSLPRGPMAVIIQAMVPASHAGVLFTRDPMGVREDELVIEAAPGLGDALTRGTVTPRRYYVHRTDLSFPDDRSRDDETLDPDTIRTIARLGLRAERLFGGAQDVEWAVAGERVFLLQARPVTAVAPEPGRDRWVAANAQEALTEPVTPLTWSFLTRLIEEGRVDLLEALDLPDIGSDYLMLVHGRPYFNVDHFHRFLEKVPAAPRGAFDKLIFGEGDPGDLSFPLPRLRWASVRLLWTVLRERAAAKRRMDRFLREASDRLADLRPVELEPLDDRSLLVHLDRVTEFAAEALTLHVLGTAVAGAHYLLLSRFLARALPDLTDGNPAATLVGRQGGIPTADAARRLYDLARVASRSPAVEEALREGPGGRSTLSRLAALGEEAAPFRQALAEFLRDYGHRAASEAELAAPRWREDPSFVLDAVRTHLEADLAGDPRRSEERQREEKADLVERLEEALPWWKRFIFRRHLSWAETYAPYRESLRFEGLRGLARIRVVFLEIGRRLARREHLTRPEDVFFLEEDELRQLIPARPSPRDFRAVVSRRRMRRLRDMALEPAPVVDGSGRPLPASDLAGGPPEEGARTGEGVEAGGPADAAEPRDAEDAEDGVLARGLGVSTGVVRGRVRHVRSRRDLLRLRPGDILVARAANPSWTPLFLLAGGIVLELGGLLSHAAVLAREYGIPCVMNVSDALEVLEEGTEVRLDAGTGTIGVVPTPEPAPTPTG